MHKSKMTAANVCMYFYEKLKPVIRIVMVYKIAAPTISQVIKPIKTTYRRLINIVLLLLLLLL